ncbi:Protein ALP1-like [Linum grandiflorum]
MDDSFLLMLSNLLHLHNSLDPSTTSLLSSSSPSSSTTSSPSPSSTLLATSSAAPLLFFTLASLLSFLACSKPKSRKSNSSTTPIPPENAAYSIPAFRALSTGQSWSLEAPLRDAQWRALYGLSYPLFTIVVEKLKPFIAASNLSLPADYAVAMVLSRLAHGYSAKTLASRFGYPSVQLQVVSDHKKVFWDVCVKAPGGIDDATHFRDSLLYNRHISGDVVWDKVINVKNHHVRPYVVGDWCYPLLSFLMTPFSPNGAGTPAQNLFDGMLMKGRSVVVDAIGLLKSRWKMLQDMNVGLNHAPQTIVACCVLHNLCQLREEPEPDLWTEPDETAAPARVLESEKSFHYFGDSLRQALADDLHQRLSSR